MKHLLQFNDFKIQSKSILFWTVGSCLFFVFFLFIAEVFIDLKATSINILAPLLIGIIIISVLTFKFPENNFIHHLLILYSFITIEIHYLANVNSFHIVVFCLTMVPLLALLIKGLRASLFWLLISIITTSVNLKYVNATFGDFYTIEINEFNFYVLGILFCISYIAVTLILYSLLGAAYNDMKSKNKELDILKNKVEEKKLLLEKYQQNLLKLSKNESISSKEKNQLFKIICKTAAKTLEISRVSIWLFENEKSVIERHFLYELNKESDELVTLSRKDFPKYFEAVESKPYITAIDAKVHPDTMEFKDDYLSPLGIYSMLDCPIIIDRETFGVICCEHKNELKKWSTEDELYVQFLANFISLGIKNSHVKLLLDDIVDKNNELIGKNEKIKSMNEELNFVNEELKTINDSLEETIKNRTFELESQNKQLSEYAFINSHLLRAPLSRVLGLSDLISREVTIPKDTKLLHSLLESSVELDSIVKKISDILYEGNHITREDVNSIINKKLKVEDFE